MTAPLHERLAEAAKESEGHSETIGESAWFQPGELREIARIGTFGASGISVADDALLSACDPESIAKLCEQVRVLLAAVQTVEDFISGKPGAPEPFGITRDALKFVKESQ